MLSRLRRAAALLRPRTIARLASRLDTTDASVRRAAAQLQRTRDDLQRRSDDALGRLRGALDALARRAERDNRTLHAHTRQHESAERTIAALNLRLDALTAELAATRASLDTSQRRIDQLVAIAMADTVPDAMARLHSLLEPERMRAHALRALAKSVLHTDPFPYAVVDDLLPADVYDALIDALPPRVLFEDRPVNKQQLRVPPQFAPATTRHVWRFLINELVDHDLQQHIVAKFDRPLTEYLQRFWPGLTAHDPDLTLKSSDGRIILRRAGYVIPPHRDPRWGFITVILYLARPGDPETWGTQLFRVRDDSEATSSTPHWIGDERCELVRDVPFVGNRALIFINSDGAHGASIPADAPADFERYIYQWRIGPDSATMKRLAARLAPEGRAAWAGKDGY
jgi:hypothetical protein